MSNRINTLQGIPQEISSFVSKHAPHLPNMHLPTRHELVRGLGKHKAEVLFFATTALLLASCAVDPSIAPTVPKQDGLRILIENNPFYLPQLAATVAGITAATSVAITSGLKHLNDAMNPGKHGYNYANGAFDTVVDVASDGSTAAYAAGVAVLLFQLGVSKQIIDVVLSQLPLLGAAGLAIAALNVGDKVKDVLGLIHFPEGVGQNTPEDDA